MANSGGAFASNPGGHQTKCKIISSHTSPWKADKKEQPCQCTITYAFTAKTSRKS